MQVLCGLIGWFAWRPTTLLTKQGKNRSTNKVGGPNYIS
jgi:hypothetical protein